jgi:hypothetical protein
MPTIQELANQIYKALEARAEAPDGTDTAPALRA